MRPIGLRSRKGDLVGLILLGAEILLEQDVFSPRQCSAALGNGYYVGAGKEHAPGKGCGRGFFIGGGNSLGCLTLKGKVPIGRGSLIMRHGVVQEEDEEPLGAYLWKIGPVP